MKDSFVKVDYRSLRPTKEIRVDRGTIIVVGMITNEKRAVSLSNLYERFMEVYIEVGI